LVKIGGDFYMTAVEVKRWPERFSEKKGKFDRDTGEGVGHLFRFNDSGVLLDDVVLGKDSIYHPGGLDFDGQNLWIPVCEYRPLGNSIVYRYNLKDRIADRKSTRLNSSHVKISYAVFCLKKKKNPRHNT